jgi:exopolyphosphatase/guanosine-5'-triphosphate,3'-diphosphate pyrophosphatase
VLLNQEALVLRLELSTKNSIFTEMSLKLAAVDIGSNAIRFQISTVLDKGPRLLFKKLEYVRFPLRLGHDVFSTNRISDKSIEKFVKLMRTYKLLIELYEADDYMFCATSAMRESENGEEVAKRVYDELGITINIISGHEEADMVNRAIASYLSDQSYIHIDVGGGSTELNIYVDGKKIKTRSFKIGSVRVLEHTDSPIMWQDMEDWVKKNIGKDFGKLTAVGTGGNISKIFELARLKPGKSLSLKKFQSMKKMIESKTIDQRIYELQMNPDRADVIIPASDIYMKVMQWAKAEDMLVPDVGLKDGILLHLLEKARQQKKLEF